MSKNMNMQFKTILKNAFKWLSIFTFIDILFQSCSLCHCIPDLKVGFPLNFWSFISNENTISDLGIPLYESKSNFTNLIFNYLIFLLIAIILYYNNLRRKKHNKTNLQ